MDSENQVTEIWTSFLLFFNAQKWSHIPEHKHDIMFYMPYTGKLSIILYMAQ